MSVLRDGDAKFHHTGGNHRWAAPSGSQDAWEEALNQHLDAHRNEGMPTRRRAEPPCRREDCK